MKFCGKRDFWLSLDDLHLNNNKLILSLGEKYINIVLMILEKG